MISTRLSGILLHPTSLSSTPGIGTLGAPAYKFVDWLAEAGQSLWQVLPLGPTGYGDSPYASFSTFAGNPLLVDLGLLLEKKWISAESVEPPEYIKTDGNVDFGAAVYWKNPVLAEAAAFFLKNAPADDIKAYKAFKKSAAHWLDTYASFMSIKAFYDKKASEEGAAGIWFLYWDAGLRLCKEKAVAEWNEEHSDEIERIKVVQFFFYEQWKSLKAYANSKGVKIIGDIPIFVAADSADVWANQRLFQLKADGSPSDVSGVPPDYFSATGQLWGNPLYKWKAHAAENYKWWVARIRHILSLVDFVRIDHFRGFESYWSVPYGEETAINGKWKKGPGVALFEAAKKELGEVPVIAEDLGIITEAVGKLRDALGFPGMKVLQFAFDQNEAEKDGMKNAFLPHNHCKNSVVYTGTHDNDTTQGWLDNAPIEQVRLVAEYLFAKPLSEEEARLLCATGEIRLALIKAAIASSADMAVVSLQDVLGLSSDARMNFPGRLGANWSWRFDLNELTTERAKSLKFLSALYGRNGLARV